MVQNLCSFSVSSFSAAAIGVTALTYFNKYNGLYFWTMQVASWGIFFHAVPAAIRYITGSSILPVCVPFIIGWYCMVTGQAVVQYSRLHLVVLDMRRLRWVLWMIIFNFIVLQIPMTILFLFVNLGNTRFSRAAKIYDRIQLCGFCIQESIISIIYIYESCRALKPLQQVRGRAYRRVHWHLIIVNAVVLILNALLLFMEYQYHTLEVSLKTVVYTIKLKIEFSVLRKLTSLTGPRQCTCQLSTDLVTRSSDLNIFDTFSSGNYSAHPATLQDSPVFVVQAPQRESVQNSTYEFHQALRETSSANSVLSRAKTYVPLEIPQNTIYDGDSPC
ncbi:hypothetical protein N7495_009981 [Penicillium taxi]|uniref:uncharacterized protein n=1 Tax=Penicillium taxi TaxID=168475 RepID=UPI002545B24F|nr:uncharacterized protein N7495_009981 [Penicillium taxi]KAJ5885471.1 hypothetical protein N7495_009981 [Penicillium taxi]